MAQTEIEIRQRRSRAELIAALGEARTGISRDAAELSNLTNVPKRIRSTLADAPLRRAATAMIAGLVGSRFLSKKKRRPRDGSSQGWLRSFIPDFDLKKILAVLLKCYLEPDEVDLPALIRAKVKDYLK